MSVFAVIFTSYLHGDLMGCLYFCCHLRDVCMVMSLDVRIFLHILYDAHLITILLHQQYSSVDEATAARNGLYNKKWPPSFGNLLVAEFVDPNDVKARSEGILEKTVNATQASVPPPHNKSSLSTPSHGQLNALPPPPPLRERLTQVQVHKEPEPQVLTLDDLFRKTKAKPHIYYLPLTDAQVSQKLGVKQKEQELMRKPSARA